VSFLILGLPRSRTAWLANFMSYDGYCCHHEGSNGCYTMKEYKAKLGPCIGDANTGLAFLDINKLFPDTNIIIIDSTIDTAVEHGLHQYKVDCTDSLTIMKDRLDNTRGLHIPFDEIDNSLEVIWDYITSGKPFNTQRVEMLKGLDIKVKEPYIIDVPAARSLFSDCK